MELSGSNTETFKLLAQEGLFKFENLQNDNSSQSESISEDNPSQCRVSVSAIPSHGVSKLLPKSPFIFFTYWMEPKELRERVKSIWSVVAIIAALTATIAFSNLNSLTDDWPYVSVQFHGVFNFLSGLMCTVAAIIITVCWAALESTPMENTKDFFTKFSWVLPLPAMFYIIGCFSLIIGYGNIMLCTYDIIVFWCCTILSAAFGCCLLGLQALMHTTAVSYCKDQYGQRKCI